MKKWCKWFVGVLLVCSACSSTNNVECVVSEFEEEGVLVAKEHIIPEPILLPRYIGITGDYLYVYKEREKNMFVLFRLSDLSYIMETGSKGQGPHDFNLVDTRSFTPTEDGFKVIEAGSGHLKDVVVGDKGFRVRKSQRIFPKGVPSNGFYPLADSLYLSLGKMDGENEFTLIDVRSGNVEPVGLYPDWEGITERDEFMPFIVFLKRCAVHPSQNKFAAFYSKFKRFRIYDSKVNLLHDVRVQTEPYFTSFFDETEKWPVYYLGEPYVTQNLIFSLCSYNKTGKEGDSELHVWDWEGNPIACYSLGHSISLMTIDEKKGRVIAMDVMQDSLLYVYDLPEKILGRMCLKGR